MLAGNRSLNFATQLCPPNINTKMFHFDSNLQCWNIVHCSMCMLALWYLRLQFETGKCCEQTSLFSKLMVLRLTSIESQRFSKIANPPFSIYH